MVASLVGPPDADKRPDVDEMMGDDSVERCRHIGVAEVDVGELDGGLGVENRSARLVDVRLPLLDCGLGREVLPAERRLTIVLGLIVGLLRLRVGERRFRLFELRLVLITLDAEELRPFLGRRAVLVVDRAEVTLHPRHQIDGIERRRVAGEFEVERDRALDRLRHHDLRRRRRHVGVLRIAGGEREPGLDEQKRLRGATSHTGRETGLDHAAPLFEIVLWSRARF